MHNATFSELRRGLGVTAGTSIREEMHFAEKRSRLVQQFTSAALAMLHFIGDFCSAHGEMFTV